MGDETRRQLDRNGTLRRVSRYRDGAEHYRAWHRTEAEAGGGGTCRYGQVEEGIEVGTWNIIHLDGRVETVELGPRCTDALLLMDPAATARRAAAPRAWHHDACSSLARFRIAGHERDARYLEAAAVAGPPWPVVDDEGALVSPAELAATISERVHALVWGLDADGFAALADQLFAARHVHAALDLIGAALLLRDDPRFHQAAAAYRRALGGEPAAPAAGLDARATALLEQIRAAPDDDAPRLVLADLIAEAHPEHAELIVAQCTAPRARRGLEEAFRRTLAGWFEDAPPCVRGFVPIHEISIEAARFLARCDDLFRCAPGASRLCLRDVHDHAAPLAALPALARYEHLSFAHQDMSELVEPLARSPHLAELHSLDLGGTGLSLHELRVLLGSRAYPRLERLDLAGCRHVDALRALHDAPFAGTLRRLGLDHCPFGGAAIPLLDALPRLDALSIARGDLEDEQIHALVRTQRRFVELGLRANRFGPEAAAVLATSPIADELEELDVRGAPIGESGCLAVAGSPRLRRLRALAIGGDLGSQPGPALAARLASSVFAPILERLELSGCDVGAAGAAALAAGPFGKLTHLDLSYSRIGDGLHALVRAPYFASLRYLNLTASVIHDRGAHALIEADSHPELVLEIEPRPFTLSDEALAELRDRFGPRLNPAASRSSYPSWRLRT